MQSDDVIWQLIKHGFCSFKAKTETQTFCRNKFNVTGLCTKSSCPLANSRYATIIEKDGKCYLYMKTIERAHLPAKLWEVIELGDNFKKALEKIDEQLIYWPKGMINKVKHRLTKIWQYILRMRKLRSELRPKMVTINKKIERREAKREYEALSAAHIERQIKQELLERLSQNAYGEIYNFAPTAFEELLDDEKAQEDEFLEEPYVEGEYDDMPGDLEDMPGDSADEDEEVDMEDLEFAQPAASDEEPESQEISDEEEGTETDKSEDESDGAPQPKRHKGAGGRMVPKKAGIKTKTPPRRRKHLEIEMEDEMQTNKTRH